MTPPEPPAPEPDPDGNAPAAPPPAGEPPAVEPPASDTSVSVTSADPRRPRRQIPVGMLVLSVLAMFAVGLAAGLSAGTWLGSVPRPGAASAAPSGDEAVAPSALPDESTASPGVSQAQVTTVPGAPASTVPVSTAGAVIPPTDGATMGRADAPLTVEVWADYQCPYCGKFAREIQPALIAGPVARGTVRLVHRDLAFLGQESVDAAVFARYAATQGKFWEAHDLLYASQDGENTGAFSRDKLVAMGRKLGLTEAGVRAAFDDEALLAALQAETGEGVRIGINSTPSIVLSDGTRILRIESADQLVAVIEDRAKSVQP